MKCAGPMSGAGGAITIYDVSAAGLRAALERCWLGSMLGPPDFVSYRSGLRRGVLANFCVSVNYSLFSLFHHSFSG